MTSWPGHIACLLFLAVFSPAYAAGAGGGEDEALSPDTYFHVVAILVLIVLLVWVSVQRRRDQEVVALAGGLRLSEQALRASEARLRLLTAQMPGVLWTTDLDLKITWASGAALGDMSQQNAEVVGWTLFHFFHTEDPAFLPIAAHKRALAGENVSFEFDWFGRSYETHVEPLRGTDETLVGAISVALDITDRKNAEEALRASEEQLRQSQKMEAVGRLAGGVAHDFNNSLTAILGYAEMIARKLPPRDPLQESANEIIRSATRSAGFTRQLLAFSRRQVLQPKVLDLNAEVTDMEKLLRRLIGEDIHLIIQLGPGLSCVKADPGQIEQVILNLAVNARDAMPRGGRLTIETANVMLDAAFSARHEGVQPGAYVMLAVNDTGVGMDAETQLHLFEPFFTTKEVGKGTGLGLSTVYGIVNQSGGHILVVSSVGQGTAFKIYLPRVDEVGEEPPPREPKDTLSPPGSETILLVEDEDTVRTLVRLNLEDGGYQVLEAADGREALRVSAEHPQPIHLLLTDVVMPHLTGPELAKRLQPLRPETRIIYMSGYAAQAIHTGMIRPGDVFIEKPFTNDLLLRKIREVLDSRAPGEKG